MEQPWPMNRLLHGDVGSGKTLVALLAALRAIERGEQAVLMVPTELLARQHAWTAAAILSQTDVNVALAIGAAAAPARRALREAVAAGEIDLVVGTHALFSADVIYANLGLVIIDEQHRFGVSQRRAIMERGTSPDLLLMSATPIPRSLALTAFGDSDVSAITHLPPGRKPIRTRLARMGNEERVYRFVHKELEAGRQAYFVYPAIDEGGTRGLRSAAEMAEILAERFAPYTVGVAHSRLDQEERAATMEQFKNGLIHVLVATSVVEVGVDVPNATCIVIEHAELFGLAALHQLRGRVGRGEFQSHCILVYQEPLTDDAKERLRVLYQSNDGFHIAEEDLRIRGPGDLLGTRQAGFLRFRFADIRRDMELMLNARRHIAAILRDDPDLTQTEHRPAAAELTRAESAASEADR
jgi:ATP-dependent DNA helicase RecG